MRVVTAGWRQLSEVGIKVRATLRTGVLRIGDHEITRTPHVEMPQIVQRPLELLVPRGLGTTTRTCVLLGIATVGDALWLWQLCKRCDPFRRVGAIRAVIPSVGSGRYAPGPNIALLSLLECLDQNNTINVLRGPPGILAIVSKNDAGVLLSGNARSYIVQTSSCRERHVGDLAGVESGLSAGGTDAGR